MSTADSAGQHLVASIASYQLSSEECHFLQEVQPAGIILFSRNIQDPDQLQDLIQSIREEVSPLCTIWLDQEGGRVQRLRDPFTRYPNPWRWAELARRDAGQAAKLAMLAGQLCGMELAAIGIGINCAPVLDLREKGADPVIGERAFGDTPQQVIMLAGAWLDGLQSQGIMGVGKHFPGHGAARADSHKSLPVISGSREELGERELMPFRLLLPRLSALMTAHLVAKAFDEEPATWSRELLHGLLRKKWGFNGLIVSDALEMGALHGPLSERAQRALSAGCDLLLCCTGHLEDNQAVLEGISEARSSWTPTQSRTSEERIRRTLAAYAPPPGDWRGLLRQSDYQRYRLLMESNASSTPQEDPTETHHS
ncbi:beta-N-acetylhexosaminidase [Candidatus Magnetaquicoccus inordinatus]|uniref:beta-N-acetylhexosaminidase n=1 Tax=Candidatus Magnetaquicoccus inordinatus TaxID=2496818 RepID=UPI00102BF0F2|nr:beta-N-acetylhexosaminidase [Candidatus Magnetaquicoccus inordinatus]